MKNLLTTFIAFMCLFFGQNSFGQKKSTNELTVSADNVSSDNEMKFECTKIVYNDKSQVTKFLENVSLKTDKVEFTNADKVIYNQVTRKMIIYGCKDFTIDGKIVTQIKKHKKNVIEYTFGSDIAYIL